MNYELKDVSAKLTKLTKKDTQNCHKSSKFHNQTVGNRGTVKVQQRQLCTSSEAKKAIATACHNETPPCTACTACLTAGTWNKI